MSVMSLLLSKKLLKQARVEKQRKQNRRTVRINTVKALETNQKLASRNPGSSSSGEPLSPPPPHTDFIKKSGCVVFSPPLHPCCAPQLSGSPEHSSACSQDWSRRESMELFTNRSYLICLVAAWTPTEWLLLLT